MISFIASHVCLPLDKYLSKNTTMTHLIFIP